MESATSEVVELDYKMEEFGAAFWLLLCWKMHKKDTVGMSVFFCLQCVHLFMYRGVRPSTRHL